MKVDYDEKPAADTAAVQEVLPALYAMQEFDDEANRYESLGRDVFIHGHSEPVLTCQYEADAPHIANMLNAVPKLVKELLAAERSLKLQERKARCAVERTAVLSRAYLLSSLRWSKPACFECPALDSCPRPDGKKHPKCREILREWCEQQAKKELKIGL